ncbi:MAG: exodeoxyribonuclease III [Microscillaceae bacterium]|jgi:exodeoxyribonuclease-3|nr:exodeoxyribonuclease III [Microscillaceae bacterium]
MKVITYNLNGIRSAIQKGWIDWLRAVNADVVCVQETKAQKNQVPLNLLEELGYKTFFQSAQKLGYSGVAIFSKTEPKHIQYGYEPEFALDDPEGRVLRADYEGLSIISVYMPSGSSGQVRQDFKMVWLEQFYTYIQALKQTRPNLLIVGDYNICHQAIDIHNPKANVNTSGFLPEERAWLTKFMDLGFIDTFRHLNSEPHHYTWWSTRSNARERNLGWRIDYQLLSQELQANLTRAVILPDARHSDHCPVLTEIVL